MADTKAKFYIIRRRKDDSIVAVGTVDECMKSMGIETKESFYSIVSRNRSGVKKTYEIDVEPLHEEIE